jgi:hypothetical protein
MYLFDKRCLLINYLDMIKNCELYENDPVFQEFLIKEFDKTTIGATIEELAEFAFGSLDKAIEAFKESSKNNKI